MREKFFEDDEIISFDAKCFLTCSFFSRYYSRANTDFIFTSSSSFITKFKYRNLNNLSAVYPSEFSITEILEVYSLYAHTYYVIETIHPFWSINRVILRMNSSVRFVILRCFVSNEYIRLLRVKFPSSSFLNFVDRSLKREKFITFEHWEFNCVTCQKWSFLCFYLLDKRLSF